jgi:hypothetical protein
VASAKAKITPCSLSFAAFRKHYASFGEKAFISRLSAEEHFAEIESLFQTFVRLYKSDE